MDTDRTNDDTYVAPRRAIRALPFDSEEAEEIDTLSRDLEWEML